MTSRTKSFIISTFLLLSCIVIMQIHSIPFWIETTGDTGYLISITLEIAALWNWWYKRKVLAPLISLMLFAGPSLHLINPIMEEIKKEEVNQKVHALTKQMLDDNSASKKLLEKRGWAGLASKRHNEQRDLYRDQLTLLEQDKEAKYAWQNITLIALQILVVLFIMITQIQVLNQIRFKMTPSEMIRYAQNQIAQSEKIYPGWETKAKEVKDEKEIPMDELAQTVMKKLERYKRAINGNWKIVSQQLEIPQSNISRVKNTLENRENGASLELLNRLNAKVPAVKLL